ncbi:MULTISPECIES: hypothetical protein [unclassified Campylobacter]|uniref:hypothetical protein n=1 Tax=unclassified Campylobacter TaxID=2593542 RepID=UPI001BD9AD49|nr:MULTISPECIES: hypothetical protein [unclassified Campylobacter]MBT0881353.1 hypothetical protein [Campylobacter sp. 2018MI27]MBT0884279.1 hypothetical protein [Campylobacter sp. 2018MI10]
MIKEILKFIIIFALTPINAVFIYLAIKSCFVENYLFLMFVYMFVHYFVLSMKYFYDKSKLFAIVLFSLISLIFVVENWLYFMIFIAIYILVIYILREVDTSNAIYVINPKRFDLVHITFGFLMLLSFISIVSFLKDELIIYKIIGVVIILCTLIIFCGVKRVICYEDCLVFVKGLGVSKIKYDDIKEYYFFKTNFKNTIRIFLKQKRFKIFYKSYELSFNKFNKSDLEKLINKNENKNKGSIFQRI